MKHAAVFALGCAIVNTSSAFCPLTPLPVRSRWAWAGSGRPVARARQVLCMQQLKQQMEGVKVTHLEAVDEEERISLYEFVIEVPGTVTRETKKRVYREVGKNININGFRPGEIPIFMQPQLFEFTITEIIQDTLLSAVEGHGLELLEGAQAGDADIEEDIKEMRREFTPGQPMVYTAKIALRAKEPKSVIESTITGSATSDDEDDNDAVDEHVCTAHREGRDIWVPAAVADGSCKYLGHDFLAANPLPPGANVLFAGNSHMRQVVEALLCMFQGAVSSRKVLWGEGARTKDDLVTVGPDTQCRKCIPFDSTAREKLVDLCGEMQFNCACSDDLLMVDFTNGASLAYQFLRGEANKTLASVTANFSTPLAEFDAVVFNHGNSPPRPVSEFLDEVEAFLEDRPKAPPPVFFWTSTLFGRATEARNLGFNPLAAEPLGRLHLNTIPVFDMHDMMGIGEAPEASREHERVDLDHYCQPGPVSDVALVLAHAVWAALKGLPPAGPPLL